MKRLKLLMLVCVVVLAPATAGADDGGFWDWLFKWDKNNARVEDCEHLWRQFPKLFRGEDLTGTYYKDIKHEFNLRLVYYWKVGQAFPDAKEEINADGEDKNNPKLMAIKAMFFYMNHVTPELEVGGGAGYLPIFTGADLQSRGIVTGSLVYSPKWLFKGKWRGWYFRLEESYLTGDFTAAGFGATGSNFAKGGEANTSFGMGFDIRRLMHPAGTAQP
jgi:hypothetical protein